MSTK
ncbi:hypothetical protein ECEC4448_5820, partial [Escherichia coli EC4448]|jgi:hypothetical protein